MALGFLNFQLRGPSLAEIAGQGLCC